MRTLSTALLLAAMGCDDATVDDDTPDTPDPTITDEGPITCDDVARTNCVEIEGGDVAALQYAVNVIQDDTAIVLGAGTFVLNNAVTVRGANGVTIIGQGMDDTILDFSPMDGEIQANGVDIVGDDIHVEGFTILEAVKDGLRIEESDGVVIRGIRATWNNENDPENGAYGLYPVRVSNVLMEDCEAFNSADAGIYVGQCQHAVIRNNVAKKNVAGIEIENTQYADVYGNLAEDNTGGLVVFDLPGNPVVGRDVMIRDNTIINNNRDNFAPGGTVALIPAGTGTFTLASRRVEITGNTYSNNNTGDIAILSGLLITEFDPSPWVLTNEELVGDVSDLGLIPTEDGKGVLNFRTSDIYIHGNTHEDSGDAPDSDLTQPELVANIYASLQVGLGAPLPPISYDTVGETGFDPSDPSLNSNVNGICVDAKASGAGLIAMNMTAILTDLVTNEEFAGQEWAENWTFIPDAPFAPYDCQGATLIPPDMDVQ